MRHHFLWRGALLLAGVLLPALLVSQAEAQIDQPVPGVAVGYYPGGVNYPPGYYIGFGRQNPVYLGPQLLSPVSGQQLWYSAPGYPEYTTLYRNRPGFAVGAPTTTMVIAMPSSPPPMRDSRPTGGTATIAIVAPGGAEVYVGDKRLTSSGSRYTFVADQLEPGKGRGYDIRVTWTTNGARVTRTAHVEVKAGDHPSITFLAPPRRQTLTLP